MDKQGLTDIHGDGSLKEFLNLLSETYVQNRENLHDLKEGIKTLIERGRHMVKEIQFQQQREKTQEQQFATDGQKYLGSKEHVDEEQKTSTPGVEKTQEQQLPTDDQKYLGFKEHVDEEQKTSTLNVCLEEELSECKRDLAAKEREIESLLRRVAHYSDMRTKQDQRDVEDTLSLNRQSRVESDFKEFTSGERIDACIKIQKEFREKTDVNAKRLTCLIFEAVYEYLLASKAAMIDAFKEISKFIVDNGADIGNYCSLQRLKKKEASVQITIPLFRSGSEYPGDVLDGLLLAIKESAPNVKADIFLKGVRQEILKKAHMTDRERSCKLSEKLLDALDDYLTASIKLTWRMVTQVPPLKLEYQTFTYKKDCHKVVELQAEVRADRYREQRVYYLWPGLVDGGGRIISAGEVALHQ